MPVLSKSRHELFAQAVANGRSLDYAYSDGGFVRNRGNASKLMRNTAIQSRVDDLLQERAKGTLQKTISEVHYTRDTLLGYLEEARRIAVDKENATGITAATMGNGACSGPYHRSARGWRGCAFDDMTDEELMQEAVKRARELGIAGPHLVEDDSKSRHDDAKC
jgi:hypothetical protein